MHRHVKDFLSLRTRYCNFAQAGVCQTIKLNCHGRETLWMIEPQKLMQVQKQVCDGNNTFSKGHTATLMLRNCHPNSEFDENLVTFTRCLSSSTVQGLLYHPLQFIKIFSGQQSRTATAPTFLNPAYSVYHSCLIKNKSFRSMKLKIQEIETVFLINYFTK